MKISIVTVVFNRKEQISNAIKSVQGQTYKDLEQVIVDGGSTDGTMEIIRDLSLPNTKIISEKDDGIYDAINKGIRNSSGDIIGIMHSDDQYSNDNVLKDIVELFDVHDVDAIYGDIAYINWKNPTKVLRYFSSEKYLQKGILNGWIPAHTSIFFKKDVFEKYGFYKTDYRIASDVDFIIRVFFVNRIRTFYYKKLLIYMGVGGVSTSSIRNKIILNLEFFRALKDNEIKFSYIKILSRYFYKLLELNWRK